MSFAALPRELQLRIISSTLGSHPIDLAHAKSLVTVSRDCYALVSGAVWRHVRLLRPSALRAFHAAIKSNPPLARLVRSIHVGPEEQLHWQGWPLRASAFGADRQHLEVPMLFLSTTLTEEQLPRWVKPGSAFNIGHPEQDCKGVAVDLAIGEALAGIDVEPWRRGYSKSGRKVGLREWAQRLWLVQAALDLYLIEMARVEEARQYRIEPWDKPGDPPHHFALMAQPCALGRCAHYPRLEIKSHRHPGHIPAEEERFYLTRSQIWQHTARSDGPANHFDHLMLLTESSRQPLGMSEVEWSRVRSALGGPHVQWLSNEAFKRMAAAEDVVSASGDHSEESGNDYGAPNGSHSNEEDFSAAAPMNPLQGRMQKAEDLLLLAREVLASTTQITNLSLSGFLHRALDSLRGPQLLRSLSLGPGLRWWDHVLPPSSSNSVLDNNIQLVGLTRLLICGTMSTQDAAKIAGGKMKPDTVVWEMTEQGVAAEQ